MRFSEFIGQEEARLGLILNAVDPRCGGLLLVGSRGSGKSTLARLFRGLLPPLAPFVELPLNVTEDSLLGGIDLEKTLKSGRRTLAPGILSRAHGGVVLVDDINLLSLDLLALLMEPLDRGSELIEREGITQVRESRFMVVATMNQEEGDLSPHFSDRFGLCAVMETLTEKNDRLAVMRLAALQPHFEAGPEPAMREKVAAAVKLLPKVEVSADILDYLNETEQRNISPGHRGDIFLFHAARAYAALQGAAQVEKEHVDRVSNLVFAHRRLFLQEEEETTMEQEQQEQNANEDQEQQEQKEQPPPPEKDDADKPEQSPEQGERDADPTPRESSVQEEIMEVGSPFKVRRFSFRKDRRKRHATGRRTKTRVKGRGGRYVKSLLHSSDRDIALDATLRACAPYQKARGREEQMIIEKDDIRFRQRERKMGHLAIFVVDGSGSMGAQRRMVETKGAIQSLLMDCYQKRDKVAMIVFRKDRAELVLPPTASVEMAAKRLAVLPVGGKTPLAAGLMETWRLVRQVSLRTPDTRFLVVLITDGRANQAISEQAPQKEISGLVRLLNEEDRCDFIVIDTENKGNFLRADLALAMARQLDADYYTTDALKAEYLSELVQIRSEK
jgi:magnesium chelatase subunit D